MKQEAQAIVLAAGPGMRMTTLTSRTPKCLLPVGTLPIIYYPLAKLQDAGFTEVTVIVSEGMERDILKVVEQYDLKLDIDIAKVNTSNDPGTMDSLRDIASKIKKTVDEVVITTCDLITDVQLLQMLKKHYERDAALTVLLGDESRTILPDHPPPPGPKTKSSISDDILCVEQATDRLVYGVVGGDYNEILNIGHKIKKQFSGKVNVSSKFLDAHMYIMKRWLLQYILSDESPCVNMGSVKAEIIPHILSRQMIDKNEDQCLKNSFETDEYDNLIRMLNTGIVPSRYQNINKGQKIECYCYKHDGVLLRLNTIKAYWQANNHITHLFKNICPSSSWNLRHSSADIQPKAQISEDSVIGMSSVICEKTNISSTVVGNHCKINSLCCITNSILAPYINIAEGCNIENCLIFANIEKKCTLKNCIVTDSSRITLNMTATNEILEASQDYTV